MKPKTYFIRPKHESKVYTKRLKMVSQKMRIESGEVDSYDKLVCFLYLLMRDVATPGRIADLLLNMENKGPYQFTNGWLARYAENIANQLTLQS